MAESAALLVDDVFPEQPVQRWVLSFQYPLRFLFASRPAIMGHVLGIIYPCIAMHLIKVTGSSARRSSRMAVYGLLLFASTLFFGDEIRMLTYIRVASSR